MESKQLLPKATLSVHDSLLHFTFSHIYMVNRILVIALLLSLFSWVSLADTALWEITNGWVDQWLVVSLACNPSSVANGTVDATTCVITCNSGYTKSGTICIATSSSDDGWGWGGGGGGGGGGTDDTDDEEDTEDGTGSTDETTDEAADTTEENTSTEESSTAEDTTEEVSYDQETVDAYDYAFANGITTMPSVEGSMPFGSLYRRDAAKMIVNFADSIGKNTVVHESCEFTDVSDVEEELQSYILQACRLGLMGLRGDGSVAPWFRPHDTLTRAEFGALLSRMLRGTLYNSLDPNAIDRYARHLQALQDAGIMNYIDNPDAVELRVYAWIVFMRLNSMMADLNVEDDIEEEVTDEIPVEEGVDEMIVEEDESLTGDEIEEEIPLEEDNGWL